METKEQCSVKGCKRPYRSKGYCVTHFKKWRRGEMPAKARYSTCGETGCRKPLLKGGLCETHHQAWVASRKPDAPAVVAPAVPEEAPAAVATEAKIE